MIKEIAGDVGFINKIFNLLWPEVSRKLQMDRDDFVDYVLWHIARGYLTICFEQGEPIGVIFYWRISDPNNIPDWPEEEAGDYVYCPFAVGQIDMFPQVIRAARTRFEGVKYFCFQRSHRGDDRVRIWRMKDE